MSNLGIEDVKSKIKKPQLEAIKVIEDYLNSDDIEHQALIKMPTGTGKTGIMGIVSNFYDDYKNVLIVVPNSILPGQIEEEIWNKFWVNIRIDRNRLKLKFPYTYKVKDFQIPEKSEGTIIITTIQSLVTIYQEEIDKYLELQQKINLVIFDEGHREPSLIWSKAINKLHKKTILFTATPYRNDNALFHFHKSKYKYSLTFSNAIKLGLIKNFSFKVIPENSLESYESFSSFILNILQDSGDQKILIRCKSSDEVLQLTKTINDKYQNDYNKNIALGCHSNFYHEQVDYLVDDGEEIFKNIDSYRILIHENMLIEGINIPEIDILVMYGDFENTRSLIQQIGRIVRKNKVKSNATVYIRKEKKEKYKSQWDKFLRYENELDNNSTESTVMYYEEEFKDMIILDDNFYKELLIPKSTILYEYKDIEFGKLVDYLEDNLLDKSNIKQCYRHCENNLCVFCYEKINYSDILRSKLYKETTLECMLLREIVRDEKKFLFYYDSRQAVQKYIITTTHFSFMYKKYLYSKEKLRAALN